MKKLFVVLALIGILTTSAFAWTEGKRVKDIGIPSHVSYIQFDNGGRVVLEAENASVSIFVQTNESLISLTSKGNQVQFYVYEIVGNLTLYKGDGSTKKISGGSINIVDSESLAITFIE